MLQCMCSKHMVLYVLERELRFNFSFQSFEKYIIHTHVLHLAFEISLQCVEGEETFV